MTFVHGDIVDAELVARLLVGARRSIRSCTSRPSRTSIGRSSSRERSCERTSSARRCCSMRRARRGARRAAGEPACAFITSRPTKSTARWRLAIRRSPSRRRIRRARRTRRARRHPITSCARTIIRTASRSTISNCSNNYGPYQFPEKLIPLMIVNALRWHRAPDLWRRTPGARLVVRRRSLRRDRPDHSGGRRGRTFNVGGRAEHENVHIVDQLCAADRRAVQRRRVARDAVSRAARPRAAGTLLGADHLRSRPARP